jgi:hypothetical protein
MAEKEFFCNCQRKLEILNQETGEYHCRSCDIRWYQEQQEVRSRLPHHLILWGLLRTVD